MEELGGPDVLEEGPEVTSPGDARTSRFYRALRWLQELLADRAFVLAFDDLHWSDGDSLALLSYLGRRIASLPVAVVATLRPWPPAAENVCLRLEAAGHARGRVAHRPERTGGSCPPRRTGSASA